MPPTSSKWRHTSQARRARWLRSGGGDGRPQRRRNQETLFRLQRTDTRTCRDCHDNTSLTAAQRSKPAYEGVDLSGLNNIQSSSMSWDYIKRLRDQTKMKMVLKGIMTWGMPSSRPKPASTHHRVEPRRPQRGRRRVDDRALPEIITGRGLDAGLDRFRLPPHDVVKALCMGAKAVCMGRPYLWGSAPSASRASSACSKSSASKRAPWSSRWAHRRSSI